MSEAANVVRCLPTTYCHAFFDSDDWAGFGARLRYLHVMHRSILNENLTTQDLRRLYAIVAEQTAKRRKVGEPVACLNCACRLVMERPGLKCPICCTNSLMGDPEEIESVYAVAAISTDVLCDN
jgi:hypothetical protein